jgi:type IV secretory pathway ATPase VirB11/archaellum biosynthesis ATPase
MRAESQKPKVIFVLGGPGSGKGTQVAAPLLLYRGNTPLQWLGERIF